ncbi:MAG: hypothetical protein BGO98_01880 [Myxococcales bacterium 68-20]|nr:MAG: hypothetical protein BGO98_01880 [Myxococcales bacterium 68-20]
MAATGPATTSLRVRHVEPPDIRVLHHNRRRARSNMPGRGGRHPSQAKFDGASSMLTAFWMFCIS